jgi:MFS family permease
MSLALTGLPYLCLAFAVNYLMMMIVTTFTGIGANLWHPAAFSFLAKRYPERKGFVTAVHTLGGNLGISLSPLALGFALTFLPWRQVLILNFLPGLIMTLVLWRLLARAGTIMAETKGKQLSVREYAVAVKTMFRNRHILLLCVLAGMRSMTQSGLFTFLPLYLVHDLKYSPALLGIYLTVIRGVGTLASPIAGKISDTRGRRPVLTMGLTVTSVLLVALVVLKLHFLFIALLALLCFFLFSLSPVMLAWMMDLTPSNVGGTTVSAIFGIQSVFSGFAPPVCGLIADRFGLLSTFYFLGATLFAANFLVYLIPEKASQEEALLVR